MSFTTIDYAFFLGLVFTAYWLIRDKAVQNLMLLAVSYFFYGYVSPWFCLLVAATTLFDFLAALGIERYPPYKKTLLAISLVGNLGLLAVFKYFNFFAGSVVLELVLPVGISFYTFQSMSYTIDVYRGEIKAKRNFIEFALFVIFFPQLVAGPIERAGRLLAQIATARCWDREKIFSAVPLFILGYFKKLVVADNISPWVDRVFMLEEPSFFLLFVGSLGFAIQIYADFSAYTDMARASARLLGFELMENFNAPFLALSPSDFWRRWHISFSSWIRDYLYIPLGGSRLESLWKFAIVVTITMGLSGLWHGAAWHFVAWGLYHAFLLFGYHAMGFGGKWRPTTIPGTVFSWAVFQFCSVIGWMIFRAPSLEWLLKANSSLQEAELLAGVFLLLFFAGYTFFLALRPWLKTGWHYAAIALIFLFANRVPQQFIYFQF